MKLFRYGIPHNAHYTQYHMFSSVSQSNRVMLNPIILVSRLFDSYRGSHFTSCVIYCKGGGQIFFELCRFNFDGNGIVLNSFVVLD